MNKKVLLLGLGLVLVATNAYALNLARVKTWSAAEILTAADLNAEFNNILNHAIVNADISASAGIVGSKLDLSVPGAIGGTTPNTGSFTTITGSGNMTIDTDTLFVNASTEKVGIGTTGVSSYLTILGSIGIGTTSTSSTYRTIAAPDGGMIIEGNVGIGKTAPAVKLDVVGAVTSSGNITGASGTFTTLYLAGTNVATHLSSSSGTFAMLNVTSEAATGLSVISFKATGVTSLGNVAAGTWSGDTIAINKGGTGTATTPAAHQLLISQTAGTYTPATLTAGVGIGFTNSGGALTINSINRQTFTSSGTFSVPASASMVYVTMVGGGGGGGGSGATSDYGSGGGGAYMLRAPTAASGSISIVVGAGGAGGAASSNGTAGTSSVFGSLVVNGGGGGSSGSGGAGGAAPNTNMNAGSGASLGLQGFIGGTGGNGNAGSGTTGGAGGGSYMGVGGAGGTNGNNGSNGNGYGSGGGAAGGGNKTGGSGAYGCVIVEW